MTGLVFIKGLNSSDPWTIKDLLWYSKSYHIADQMVSIRCLNIVTLSHPSFQFPHVFNFKSFVFLEKTRCAMTDVDITEDAVDTQALQAQIDLSMSFAQNLVSSWMKPHKLSTNSQKKDIENELKEYMRRPPR